MSATPHITVCICTFKRPEPLARLLTALRNLHTEDLFTYSAVVADNDSERSAESVATAFASGSLTVKYCVEPRQNIALARNRALQEAEGDFIAFIDDDEFPTDQWLFNLFQAHLTYRVSCVLGPVVPHFDYEPPKWVKRGKFFDRPEHPTGYKIAWREARTGNVLFKRDVLDSLDTPFREEFGTGGEDVDFFRRLAEKAHEFAWCNEAVVFEVVPTSRCSRSYLLKRALLRGSNSLKNPKNRAINVLKSMVAVPCYVLALPILAVFSQRLFMDYLIKVCDHIARLSAFIGLRLLTHRES
jgi:glycosyltransferase involved in cell wall biosynthesis